MPEREVRVPSQHADADDKERGGAVEQKRRRADRFEGKRGAVVLERFGGEKQRRGKAGAEEPRDGPFGDDVLLDLLGLVCGV